MFKDKLSREERARLEALAQAIVASRAPARRQQATRDILQRAKAFEDFIVTGNVPR